MTVDANFEMVLDVFVRNSVFYIDLAPVSNKAVLSAALILSDSKPLVEAQSKSMAKICDKIILSKPSYSVWLLMSSGGQVQFNRVIGYYRLWGALKKSNISLPRGSKTKEYVKREGDEVQYFGAINLERPNFSEVADLIRLRPSSHLFLSTSEQSILQLLENGWQSYPQKYPFEILRHAEDTPDIILSAIGEFDDMEGGAVAIARPSVIQSIFMK